MFTTLREENRPGCWCRLLNQVRLLHQISRGVHSCISEEQVQTWTSAIPTHGWVRISGRSILGKCLDWTRCLRGGYGVRGSTYTEQRNYNLVSIVPALFWALLLSWRFEHQRTKAVFTSTICHFGHCLLTQGEEAENQLEGITKEASERSLQLTGGGIDYLGSSGLVASLSTFGYSVMSAKQKLPAHSKGCSWRRWTFRSIQGNGGDTMLTLQSSVRRSNASGSLLMASATRVVQLSSLSAKAACSHQLKAFESHISTSSHWKIPSSWEDYTHTYMASCYNARQQQEELSTYAE